MGAATSRWTSAAEASTRLRAWRRHGPGSRRPGSSSCPGRLLVAMAAVLAGCATTAGAPPPPPATPAVDDVVVRLVGLDFAPATVRIPVGGRVLWQWTDSVVHNVTSPDFASSKNLGGGSYAVRFDRPGTFPYECTLHARMTGTVVVVP
ncbi:MAG: cupredoxin domain-containing protein [Acidimicrobiales bacterium]